MIDKVFVGDAAGTAPATEEGQQPVFAMDFADASLTAGFRGFRWLTLPEGSPLSGPYNPPDAYVLLFDHGIALLEQHADGQGLMDGPAGAPLSLFFPSDPGTGDSFCGGMTTDMGEIGVDGAVRYGACWDLRTLRPDVDLADMQILRSANDVDGLSSTFHLFADRNSDEVVVVRTDRLLGQSLPLGVTSVNELVQKVKVGIGPTAFSPSSLVTCDGTTQLAERPVMLVANQGSQDVSVLGVDGEDVAELAVIAMPAVPVSFFLDVSPPTCADPYAWVVGDDGRSFPLDMRDTSIGIPSCGDETCGVATRRRAEAGAIARTVGGRSRVLIGGDGLLGEVGFLRPARDACFSGCARE
jgi:hypothetical protein